MKKNKMHTIFKSRKPLVVAGMVIDKIFHNRMKGFDKISYLFKDKKGIEIGGPSKFFSADGFFPVYPLATSIDGCNFSSQTVWEGNLQEGENYVYNPGKQGQQYICEGAEVEIIDKDNYNFLLSCNNLEHIANPIKAVGNWLALLKHDGTIVLVLPRKQSNFDHKRTVTSFEHLLSDYKNNTSEADLSHINEILQLHDLKLDPLAGDFQSFKERSLQNFTNRCLHHHVYDIPLLEEICNFFNLQVIIKISLTANHILIARKSHVNY